MSVIVIYNKIRQFSDTALPLVDAAVVSAAVSAAWGEHVCHRLDKKHVRRWADKIRARQKHELLVQKLSDAGGRAGDMTCTLAWWNTDDLDLHCRTPDGTEISYENRSAVGA